MASGWGGVGVGVGERLHFFQYDNNFFLFSTEELAYRLQNPARVAS